MVRGASELPEFKVPHKEFCAHSSTIQNYIKYLDSLGTFKKQNHSTKQKVLSLPDMLAFYRSKGNINTRRLCGIPHHMSILMNIYVPLFVDFINGDKFCNYEITAGNKSMLTCMARFLDAPQAIIDKIQMAKTIIPGKQKKKKESQRYI